MMGRKIGRHGDEETRRCEEFFTFRIFVYLFVFSLLIFALGISAQNKNPKGRFPIVSNNQTADIYVSDTDFKVAKIAAEAFAGDVELISGKRPAVKTDFSNLSKQSIIIGTLGKNELIDKLIAEKKLDVSQIENKRESFLITNVAKPFPGVENALVIVGSDRRGTAYGTFEVSEKIGVSPWVWWADVAPEKRETLIISNAKFASKEPSVKYRGIFLNDEDWGLQPWAAKTFEPETGNIGPKTYAKIFELLLRLKANTCWSAMHEVTKPFNEIPENARVADDYAIVMGSSHAEPMLRNNVGEWKDDKAKYNFVSNEKEVTDYWEARLKTNGKFENIYTLGMRGIHDSPIQGTKTQAERIPVLEKIIRTQRNLLANHVNKNVEEIPQIFCPYKEVLADYRAGLKVPDDVTIVFPDDNFGYIRYFPNAAERNRKGGFGVYYHISYLGRPLSYLWLNTTPPALIREEMVKAYDNGMRDFWILNVGDIKPAEFEIEYFLKIAYDAENWQKSDYRKFLSVWAKREFGGFYDRDIVQIMDKYYRLGFQRKPEHLQWYLPNEKPIPSAYSAIDYGDEMQQRLNDYAGLKSKVEELYAKISPLKKDAFYELVLYPVRSAALANERFFAAEKARFYLKQGRVSAIKWARNSLKANAAIRRQTIIFNNSLAGGKWRNIMSPEMNEGQWTSMRSTPPDISKEFKNIKFPKEAKLGVAIEGKEETISENENAALPQIDVFTKGLRFIDVFNQGETNQAWTAKPAQDWINLSKLTGELREDSRISVSINWNKIPKKKEVKGEIEIKSGNAIRKIVIPVFNPNAPKLNSGFVESNGVISIEAEHFTKDSNLGGFSWQTIPGLGKSGDSVTVFPQIAKTFEPFPALSPTLEYHFYAFSSGEFDAICYLIPTQPLQSGKGLRYAIGIDNQAPQLVAVGLDAEVSSPKWSQNVLNAATSGTSKLKINQGAHTLKIYAVDTGVVLDKIVINTGGLKNSYLTPPETKIALKN